MAPQELCKARPEGKTMLLGLHIRDLRDQLGRDNLTHKHMGPASQDSPTQRDGPHPGAPGTACSWAWWAEATFL